MCSIVLCVLNVCKPREYPGFLRSYVNRKIDLIKKKWITDVSCTIQSVHLTCMSSYLIQFINDYNVNSQLERSERLQLTVCMLKQTSLPLKTDVSNFVCNMQPNWRLIISTFWTPSKITLWKFWYKFGWHCTYCKKSLKIPKE
jgi:hypothetical protein